MDGTSGTAATITNEADEARREAALALLGKLFGKMDGCPKCAAGIAPGEHHLYELGPDGRPRRVAHAA